MPTLFTVNNITGSTPFEVYLCLTGGTTCYYVDMITDTQLPYSFNCPTPLENLGVYCIRVVDNDGCIITNCTNIT